MAGKDLVRSMVELLPETHDLVIDLCITHDDEIVSRIAELQEDGCILQAIPAEIVAGWEQLVLPAILTFESYKEGYNVSDKPYIQYLLFFTGTRQIKEALTILRKFSKPPYVVARVCVGRDVSGGGPSLGGIPSCNRVLRDEVSKYLNVRSVKEVYELQDSASNGKALLKSILAVIAYTKLEMV